MTEETPATHVASSPGIGCITISIGNVLYLINRVQVTGFPQDLIDPIRQCITSTLGPIYTELDDFEAYDFRFQGGLPTMMNQTKERAKSRKFTLELLKCMLKHGWSFIQATPTMGRNPLQLDTMFFEKSTEASVQSQNDVEPDELFAIGFDNRNCIRIIDAPEAIAALVRDAILKRWKGESGILDASVDVDGSVEFQLKSAPFADFSVENAVNVQLLLGQMLTNIKTANYRLYAAVDSSGVNSNPDLPTWVFRKGYPSGRYYMNQHIVVRELVWHTTSTPEDFAKFLVKLPSANRLRWYSQFRGATRNENSPQWERLVSAIERNCKELQQTAPLQETGTNNNSGRWKSNIKSGNTRNSLPGRTYLRELELNGYIQLSKALADLLPFLGSLTSLLISTYFETSFFMDQVLRQCPHLLTLRFSSLQKGNIRIPSPWIPIELQHDSQKKSTIFPLRSLTLQSAFVPQSDLEELLSMTPRLYELKLINLFSEHASNPQYNRSRLIEHIDILNLALTSFHLSHDVWGLGHDKVQEPFMPRKDQLFEWSLWGQELKPSIYRDLCLHPNNITSLEILSNQWTFAHATKDGLHDFLCASPHLLHLKVPQMFFPLQRLDLHRVDDVPLMDRSLRFNFRYSPPPRNLYIEPGVWACRRLKTLHMGFHRHGDVSIGALVHERILFGYLSKVCPDLRDLQIRMSDIDVSLQGGLCLLSRLNSLQTLVIAISATHQKYKKTDLEWMADLPKPGPRLRLRRLSWLENKAVKGTRRPEDAITIGSESHSLTLKEQTEEHLKADLKRLGLMEDVDKVLEDMAAVKQFRCWPLLQGISVYRELDYRGELEMDVARLRPGKIIHRLKCRHLV
ncbi:unnamed protein product [Mortierella alpina]